MVASSGDRLLEPAAERLYLESLAPHALVLTPNLMEAEVLLGRRIRTLVDQHEAAHALGQFGPATVVVKGGHAVTDSAGQAVDVVWDGSATYELRSPRVDTPNNHGTGCSFAAAIAAALAGGATVRVAISRAKAFVHRGVSGAATWRLGQGHGPIDHFGWAEMLAAS
jgi:hydroxymethylpyrimidine/phosphomethylpyrimidine kinase